VVAFSIFIVVLEENAIGSNGSTEEYQKSNPYSHANPNGRTDLLQSGTAENALRLTLICAGCISWRRFFRRSIWRIRRSRVVWG